jgi:hypothetical protein
MIYLCFTFVQVTNDDGKSLVLDWSRGRIFDRDVAQVFLTLVKAYDSAK